MAQYRYQLPLTKDEAQLAEDVFAFFALRRDPQQIQWSEREREIVERLYARLLGVQGHQPTTPGPLAGVVPIHHARRKALRRTTR
jgi:hypothetical protein